MRKLASILFLTLLFCCGAGVASAAEELSFRRPTRAGDAFQTEVNLAFTREYRFVLAGPDKPVIRQESLSVTLFAWMKVLEVNSVGNPNRVELRISMIGGYLDGKAFDASQLMGKTVFCDMRRLPCRFTYGESNQRLPREARRLLGAVFRVPPENTLKDTLGEGIVPAPGKRWNISALPVMESLKQRGFELKGSSIESVAKIAGKDNFRGIDCWQVTASILSRDVPNLDFRLKADLWIPADPKLNVIRTIRSGVEVVDRMLPMDNPLSSGSSVRVITNETMEAILIPAQEEKKTPGKRSSWADFILH